MRNHENGFNGQADDRSTGWESMGNNGNTGWRPMGSNRNTDWKSTGDGVHEQSNRRFGEVEESEGANTIIRSKVRNVAASAILSLALIGALVASGVFSTDEIMNSEKIVGEIDKVEGVVSVVAKDGPNLRREPFVSGRDEPETFIIDLGEEGQTAMFFWQGKDVYRYENKNDPNGYWIGFNAEDLADTLFKNNYITSKEAERINNKDKDGMVWFNGNYIELKGNNITYNTVDSDSISSLNSN